MGVIRGWICMLFNLLLVNMQSMITVRGEPHQAKILLASQLHYFAEQCTAEMHARIAKNFIDLVTQHLGTVGGYNEKEKSAIENVRVECDEQSITFPRRDIGDSEQSSKASLTLKFDTKVPLPSNVSVGDLNQTTQQMTSDILAFLNKADLTLNITGVVWGYDASKPPVVQKVDIVCDKGQVLKGTKCGSCSPGYFLERFISHCMPCAVDEYQDQEAQTSCVPCPPGTSTLGQVASKRPEDCQTDLLVPSFTCPSSMENIPTEPGQSYAIVTWHIPVPTNNSNESLILEGLRPPQKLNVGKEYITYNVTDSSGLSRSCMFSIHVKDLEPPKISDCPDHIYKTSKENWTKIFFPEVTLTDNVGVHLFTTSRKNGSEFTWGEHNVTFTTSDIAGNTAQCHFQVIIGAKRCPDLPIPLNGAKTCDLSPDEMSCIVHCHAGYDFANNQSQSYVCNPIKGTWMPSSKVTDCSGTQQAKVSLATELHYLAHECKELTAVGTASNVTALFAQYLGTLGDCFGSEDYTIENFNVKCGQQRTTLGRKRMAYNHQPSKVPLTVYSTEKIPLPSNASFFDIFPTYSSMVSHCLSTRILPLNFSGVALEYDASKPPVLGVGSFVCDKGQVLKGTKCVNCPRGYFFNATGCQACAVDQYQDQEAQTYCVPCPRGKSTLGKVASKGCHERRKPAKHNQIPMISGTVAGIFTLITLLFVLYVRQRCVRNKRMTFNPGTTLAYTTGETVIQIETETEQDSACCSNNTLHTWCPKYVTKLETTFTSAGGELRAPLDSNVRIIVPKGAIPAGTDQPVFFGVFLDEIPLLQDIPEEPDKTLISPVVECGPHDINLHNPVEIIVPHCLCLSKAKRQWINVYRCGNFTPGFEGRLNWERVPNQSEKISQSNSWFTVGKDAVSIKTRTFSLWSIFACGGRRRKRATVFTSRPDPKSDLVYLRFYIYSDNEDSKRRVELTEETRFPDSRPAREKPFRMYEDNKVIKVKLTDLAEGWNSNKPDNTQIYKYEKARGSGFRCQDACDFAVKPEDGRNVNAFSCTVRFQHEGDDEEHSFDVYPGFTPVKRQSIRQNPAVGGQSVTASSNTYAIAGCSTSTGPEEEQKDCDSHNQEGRSSPGLGNDKPVTENLLNGISPYVGVNWKRVLRELSIEEAIIKNLEEDCKNAPVDEKCYQGLLRWKDGKGPQGATINTLCNALRLVGCSEALKALQREIAPGISHC